VKAVQSDLLCSLTVKTAPFVLKAITNAFYKAIVETELKDIPTATVRLDTFLVKTHELGQVLSNKVVFNDHGL